MRIVGLQSVDRGRWIVDRGGCGAVSRDPIDTWVGTGTRSATASTTGARWGHRAYRGAERGAVCQKRIVSE